MNIVTTKLALDLSAGSFRKLNMSHKVMTEQKIYYIQNNTFTLAITPSILVLHLEFWTNSVAIAAQKIQKLIIFLRSFEHW